MLRDKSVKARKENGFITRENINIGTSRAGAQNPVVSTALSPQPMGGKRVGVALDRRGAASEEMGRKMEDLFWDDGGSV